MRFRHTSVYVDDQKAALRFYTEVLGFVPKVEIPIGPDFWLTVVSPQDPDGPQLLLAPSGHRGRRCAGRVRAAPRSRQPDRDRTVFGDLLMRGRRRSAMLVTC